MKKWLLIFVPIILILGVALWFWSLGSVPEEEQRVVTLTIEEIGVHVRQPNAAIWETATSGMHIGEGWSVRTDETGLAIIEFFGQGESRLENGTEVTITQAMIDERNPSSANVGIHLDTGRIWSRVLKLFDLDSSYSVRTSAVVATVRGTAFDVQADADGSAIITVNESAVDVSEVDGRPVEAPAAVAAGYRVSFGADGIMGDVREVPDSAKRTEWFRRNVASDEAFVANERERRLSELYELNGPKPTSFLNGITRLSERLHLAFIKGTRKDVLAQRYLARRFMRLIELVEQGKAGLAAQEFARFENYIRTQLKGSEHEAERERILAALKRVSFLVDDADPDSPLYPFKQRIENLTELLTESDEASMIFVRLLALDARLDEAKRLLTRGSLEEARVVLDGARKGIENVSREVTPIIPQLSEIRKRTIRGKISALRAREVALRQRLEAAFAPPEIESATSTEETPTDDASPTGPTEPPPEPPSPEEPLPPPSTEPEFESISLFVQPNPLNVGESATLVVVATRADGSEQTVTALSTFELQQPIGVLNGPSFTATEEGSGMITAQFNDQGLLHNASVNVTTKSTAVLESLEIISSAGTRLQYGQSTTLRAMATYDSGYSKDVTSLTSFVLSSGVGTLNGSTYLADTELGDATITGTFTEGGKTVRGSVFITIGK